MLHSNVTSTSFLYRLFFFPIVKIRDMPWKFGYITQNSLLELFVVSFDTQIQNKNKKLVENMHLVPWKRLTKDSAFFFIFKLRR